VRDYGLMGKSSIDLLMGAERTLFRYPPNIFIQRELAASARSHG
jgi:hypothetical protein